MSGTNGTGGKGGRIWKMKPRRSGRAVPDYLLLAGRAAGGAGGAGAFPPEKGAKLQFTLFRGPLPRTWNRPARQQENGRGEELRNAAEPHLEVGVDLEVGQAYPSAALQGQVAARGHEVVCTDVAFFYGKVAVGAG